MPDITLLLSAAAAGDPQAAAELLPLVYDELRGLAAARMAAEAPGQTLDATALVHEAYLRLVGGASGDPGWTGRGHFFAAAAEAMRRILVEAARRKRAEKRGGGRARVSLDEAEVSAPELVADDLLDLDEALADLERVDRPAAELVKLRYFAGLSVRDAAGMLGIAARTADAVWAYARAWLLARLEGGETLPQDNSSADGPEGSAT